MSTPTATPRTDAALYPMNGVEIVWPYFARQLETELAAAKGECERLKIATEGHLLKTIQQQAELTRLRAELKELSQAYELNRVSIDELDADRARAERAEAALAKWSVLNLWGGTPEIIHEFIKGQQNRIHYCQDLETELDRLRAEVERWQAEAEEMSAQRSHNANQAGILRAEVEQKSNLLVTAIKSAGDQAARAERAEADKARLDWLEAHALPQHSPNISISDLGRHYNGFPGSFRAAIDAAMKGTT